MGKKYTRDYIAEFADCDRKYDLKPQTLLAWAGELAGNHLRSRNITREQMWEDGQVFLLTKAAINYITVPVYNTPLKFTTWEAGTKGSQFIRRFTMTDESENLLCDLETSWVLVNPHTHKLCRPSEYLYELNTCEDCTNACVTKFKAENAAFVKDYTFVYSDIGANGHVNNGVYLRLMSDILPEGFVNEHFKSVRVNFLHECRQGESIGLYLEQSEKICSVVGKFEDGKISFEAQAEI